MGDVKFADINGDGFVDEKDLTYIGSPHPDFTFGVTNTFSFKGIDLSVFIQGSKGASIFNYIRKSTEGMDKLYRQLSQWVLAGQLRQEIAATYPVAEYRAALAHAAQSSRNGKILLTF